MVLLEPKEVELFVTSSQMELLRSELLLETLMALLLKVNVVNDIGSNDR